MPIPAGFVVTTNAFRLGAAQFDPAGAIAAQVAGLSPDDHAAVEAVAAVIRRRIDETPLPVALRDEVVTRYGALIGERTERGAAVAVRSSATGEDSLGASYAGLQDTFLWVRGAETVLAKVARLLGEPVLGGVGVLSPPVGPARGRGRDGRGGPAHGGRPQFGRDVHEIAQQR